MRTLIIDDNKLARRVLKQFISQVEYLELAGECESAQEANDFLSREKVDLLLLDVEMPGMTGIELIKHLSFCPLVILTTSKENYAVEAFEQQVVDYLLKPVHLPRFLKSVERAKELFDSSISSKTNDFFFVRHDGTWTKITFNDILYIQALADYATIFIPGAKFTIHSTMKALEDKLPPEKFQRIHRSYIVCLGKIAKITDGNVYIDNKPVPIADSYKDQLMRKLNLL